MTAQELIARVRQHNPDVRAARDRKGNAVALWDEEYGRFVAVAGRLVTGEWCQMPPFLVNGKPLYSPEDWIEDA